MKHLITLFSFCFMALGLYAQIPKDTIATNDLPEVIVTAHGFSKQANSNTTNSNLVTEQVALIRPEKITDGLTLLPGIYSVPDGIGGQTLNIRGFEQNRVNVFFNGIPLKSNTEGRISTDGLFFTNSDISVEKGTASLIYGANSSGNVIRIDNRIFTEEKFGIKFNSFWGNNMKQSYNTLITGNIKKKFYYQASANYFKRNSFNLSNEFDTVSNQTNRTRVNSDQENLEILGTITYAPNSKHHISLTGMHNESMFGYPPSISSPRYRRMDFWHNTIIGLRHTSSFGNKINLETNLYYTYLKDTLNEYKDKTFSSIKRFSYWNDKTIGARGILSYQINKQHKLNYSIDYKNDIHEQAWFTTATTKANTLLSALEYRGEFIKRIFIDAGTSYNFTNPSYASSNENIIRKDLSVWNYQFSAAYSPLSLKYKVHAGYSRTSIFPRMRDLFGDVLIGYTANPDLTFEISDNFDIGIGSKFFKNKLSIQWGGYYSNIKNLITQVKATDTTNQVINLQSAVFSGSELMVKYSPSDKLFGMLSYSYLNAKNTSDGRTSDFIAYRPEHQFRTFMSYMPIKYIGIDLTYTFVSKRNYDNQSVWYELPDYSIFDFGITSKPIKYFTFWFKINNLLDRNYVSAFDQPLPGREFRFGLTFDFKVPSK